MRPTSHIQHKNKYNIKATHKSQDEHRGLALYSKSQSCPGREIFNINHIRLTMWVSARVFFKLTIKDFCKGLQNLCNIMDCCLKKCTFVECMTEILGQTSNSVGPHSGKVAHANWGQIMHICVRKLK